MEKNIKLEQATRLYSTGHQTEATVLFREVMANTKDPVVFLNAVQGFVVSVSRLEGEEDLIPRTDQGIKIAEKIGALDSLAYLLATKAQFINDDVGMTEHHQNNIVLTPRLMSFSLERDKKLYEKIDEKILKARKEIGELFERALTVAKDVKDKNVEGHVYTQMGFYYGAEFLRIRGKNVSKNDRFKFLYKFHFILHRGYDRFFMYSKECRKQLREVINKCQDSFEKAVILHKNTKDKNSEAYANYNYAIQLGSFGKFKKARKALNEAERLAREMSNKSLLARVILLKKSQKSKNSDTPDYLEGERRDTEGEVLKMMEKDLI